MNSLSRLLPRLADKFHKRIVFYTVLCAKESAVPLDEWQSPRVLKLIDENNFDQEKTAFQDKYRGFFTVKISHHACLLYTSDAADE